MNDSELAIGTILDGTYVLTDQLGAGGMGVVYKAKHQRLPKHVAVKVLHQFVAADKEAFTRFRREAEIASEIDHPNIVQALDFNTLEDGRPYLVLELLRGESLREQLAGGPLPLETTLTIASQIASGLAAAHHRGVVHRDLKPENIFLARPEGTAAPQVKILDFGISKLLGTQSLTQDGMMIGTPYYMSPEQAKGQAVDARTDQFALAAMIYEMLAGRPPFWGDQPVQVLFQVVHQEPPSLAQLAPSTPAKVIEEIGRALSKDAAQRFTDIGGFVLALWRASGLQPPRDSLLALKAASGVHATIDAGTGPTLPPLENVTPAQLGMAPTMASPSAPSPAFAPTLDSQGALPANAQPATLPPTFPPTAAPTSRSGRVVAIMALALLLVGGGAAAAYLVLRPSPPPPTPAPLPASRKVSATPRPPAAQAPPADRGVAAARDAQSPPAHSEASSATPRTKTSPRGKRAHSKAKAQKRPPANASRPSPRPKADAAPPPQPPPAAKAPPLSAALQARTASMWRLYHAKKYLLLQSKLRAFDGALAPSQRWISDQLQTVVSCALEDLQEAKAAFARLPRHARAKAIRLCKRHGAIDPR